MHLYTDFSNAFDKVPHFELVQKVANIGVGGCLLEIIVDYLDNRKQFVRVDSTRSETLDVTSGVPQGSLLGPLLFCILAMDKYAKLSIRGQTQNYELMGTHQ